MAKLSVHGEELARRETPTARIAVMSDGNIMKNYGSGWKLWRRVKPGVDVQEYARKFNERTAEIPAAVQTYISALIDACDLEHRAMLHNLICMMPSDPDGVWSQFDDTVYGYGLDLDDVVKACRAYEHAELVVKAQEAAA